MNKVLCESPTTDKMLTAALSAMGYDAADPILRSGHPIWDTATDNGRLKSVVFVTMQHTTTLHCPIFTNRREMFPVLLCSLGIVEFF